jgi:hypothetical protein
VRTLPPPTQCARHEEHFHTVHPCLSHTSNSTHRQVQSRMCPPLKNNEIYKYHKPGRCVEYVPLPSVQIRVGLHCGPAVAPQNVRHIHTAAAAAQHPCSSRAAAAAGGRLTRQHDLQQRQSCLHPPPPSGNVPPPPACIHNHRWHLYYISQLVNSLATLTLDFRWIRTPPYSS